MKNKEFIFEFNNDWDNLFKGYKWTTFTFILFYIEHEKWLKGWDLNIMILGIGVYIRFNYDLDFLNKKLSDWKIRELDETE